METLQKTRSDKTFTAKFASFVKYCSEGNLEEVEKLLISGEIDLNHECFTSVFNPLLFALATSNVDMAKILLKYDDGAKKMAPLYLHEACKKGYYEIAVVLVKAGADVNHCDKHSKRPLYHAVVEKHVGIVKLLLQNGAKLQENFKSDFLYNCVKKFDKKALDIVKLLLDYKIHSLEFLTIPVVKYGRAPLLRFLIDKGLDVNSKIKSADWEYNGSTPLCMACYSGSIAMVEILLKNGADPNLKTLYGDVPLIMADRNSSMIKLLLKFGADINGQDGEGNTALHRCYFKKEISFLLSRGIRTDIKNHENETVEEVLESRDQELDDDDNQRTLSRHYERSVKEVNKMKSIILNKYGLSLHDILLMDRHKLTRYLNNVELKKIFKNNKLLKKFPVFGRKLKRKFEEGEKRRKLMHSASHVLEKMTGVKNSELQFMIFEYFSDGEINSTFLKKLNK